MGNYVIGITLHCFMTFNKLMRGIIGILITNECNHRSLSLSVVLISLDKANSRPAADVVVCTAEKTDVRRVQFGPS